MVSLWHQGPGPAPPSHCPWIRGPPLPVVWHHTSDFVPPVAQLLLGRPLPAYRGPALSVVPRPFSSASLQLPPPGSSTPPQHRKSIWRRTRVTVATRGSRPVDNACSSMLDAVIRVVISASAATPAPQQLRTKGGLVDGAAMGGD